MMQKPKQQEQVQVKATEPVKKTGGFMEKMTAVFKPEEKKAAEPIVAATP